MLGADLSDETWKIKRFSTLTLLASATILVPLSTSAEETTNSSTETSSSMVEPTATEEKLAI